MKDDPDQFLLVLQPERCALRQKAIFAHLLNELVGKRVERVYLRLFIPF